MLLPSDLPLVSILGASHRASVLRLQPVEPFDELGLGPAARRGYSLALLLPLVAPAQALAELLAARWRSWN